MRDRTRWIQLRWKLMDLAARLPIVWRWPHRQRWQPRWTDDWPPRYRRSSKEDR